MPDSYFKITIGDTAQLRKYNVDICAHRLSIGLGLPESKVIKISEEEYRMMCLEGEKK